MPRTHWDIFCNVVDNYGDIGVCWRLARQLVEEHGLQVRLWVDDLASFRKLAPELDPQRAAQSLAGVEIQHWRQPFPDTTPAQVVIEAFACQLPENYIQAMATLPSKPVWINLEYLSAEPWIADYHSLPSPHPQLPLTKYFFFPGFTKDSGGLIREQGLLDQRNAFQGDAQAQAAWWQSLGINPDPQALKISLFAYPEATSADLLPIWQASPRPITCLVPETPFAARLAAALEVPDLRQPVQRGALTLLGLPFLPQQDYDRLLWACDVNFVRGEDSFVRAQWAGRPLIWNIYPQMDAVHQEKLEAFLALYGLALPQAGALASFWRTWNGWGGSVGDTWPDFLQALPALQQYASRWASGLAKQPDLATQLIKFCGKLV